METDVDLSSLERDIAAAVEHERTTGTLAKLVRQAYQKHKPGLPADDLESRVSNAVKAIQAYVEAMPTVIRSTLEAAEKTGEAEHIRPIFETALSYVAEDVDFIPDSLGVAGFVDDAYLVHQLMQEISQRHAAITGKPLIDTGFSMDTQRMRRLIGEPTATRLEVAVVAFARRHNIRETIDSIIQRIGGGGMTMTLPVRVAFPDQEDPLDDLPDLELGSFGD